MCVCMYVRRVCLRVYVHGVWCARARVCVCVRSDLVCEVIAGQPHRLEHVCMSAYVYVRICVCACVEAEASRIVHVTMSLG